MASPQLRITVYREAVGLPRLRWPEGGGEGQDLPERAEAGEWHEEVYCWSLAGGERVAPNLADELVGKFNEGIPPAQRRLPQLRTVVLAMRAQVTDEWSASFELPETGEKENAPSMVNTSAALVELLRWIAETFAHLPGAHVVVR